MEIKSRILVATGNDVLRGDIRDFLVNDGYDVITADEGEQSRAMAECYCPDLVLLDLAFSETEGLQLLKEIRKWSQMPVVFMINEASASTAVAALDNGANDYIVKPLRKGELLCRINAALRRYVRQNSTSIKESRFTVGELTVDYDSFSVSINGMVIRLTPSEFRIVSLLSRNAGTVIAYKDIITHLWGPNSPQDNRILRVYLTNIRKKLEKDSATPRYIKTVSGIGYIMAAE